MFWTRMKMAAGMFVVLAGLGTGVGMLSHRAAADGKDTPDTKTEAPVKEPEAAWGDERNGLRIGLAPLRLVAAKDAKDITVTVWYENVGKEDVKVRVDDDANVTFPGVNASVPFTVYAEKRATTATPAPKYETLSPGKKRSLRFTLPFGGKGGGWVKLPELAPGDSLMLRAQVAPVGAQPKGIMTGGIVITRAADPAAKPLVIGLDSDGKTVETEVGRRIEIRLVCDPAGAGWEGADGDLKGAGNKVVLRGRRREFEPKEGSKDAGTGTYVFVCDAVAEGEVAVHLSLLTPSGPVVLARGAPGVHKEFKVTIKVTARN